MNDWERRERLDARGKDELPLVRDSHEMAKQYSPGACRICNGVKDGFNIQSEAGCPSRQAPKVPLRG